MPYLTRNKLEPVFLDPLQIISGTGYFAGISEEEYWRVLGSASFAHSLSSLLSSGGAFFEAGLPCDELHRGMVTKMQDYLAGRLRG